ncbi:hypothetical protein GCM10027028_18660 [Streptomyces sundarbansensis]
MEVLPSVRQVELALLGGAEGACDAGVRARSTVVAGTAGVRVRSPYAGRPDTFNVWHSVTPDKAPSANNFSHLSSRGHA